MPHASLPLLLGYGAVALALVSALWSLQRRTGDAGVIDVAWGAGLAAGAVLFALTGDGAPLRRALLVVVAALPALRLAVHLLLDRVLGGDEDGRYRALRAAWGARFQSRLYLFYAAQALALVVLVSGYSVVAANPAEAPGVWDVAALAVAAVSLCGEALADRQLALFRRDPSRRGQVCHDGLWRFSRHPNYFFQWLLWFAPVLLAVGAEGAFITWIAPALMLVLLLRVTGIPPTEAQALRSRGEAYRAYRRTTSAFVPCAAPAPE